MGTGQYSGSPATPFKKRRDPKKGFHGKAGCLVPVSWTWALLSNMLKKNITSVVIALHTSKLNENNYCTASDERKHNDKKTIYKILFNPNLLKGSNFVPKGTKLL